MLAACRRTIQSFRPIALPSQISPAIRSLSQKTNDFCIILFVHNNARTKDNIQKLKSHDPEKVIKSLENGKGRKAVELAFELGDDKLGREILYYRHPHQIYIPCDIF